MTIAAKTQNMNVIKLDFELMKTISLTILNGAVFYSATCCVLFFRQPVWQLDQSELPAASSGHSDGEEELQEERIWSSDAGGFLLHIPYREVSGSQHSIITQHGCRSAIVLHYSALITLKDHLLIYLNSWSQCVHPLCSVCQKFLQQREEHWERLYEVEAPGGWSQRRNIWLSIQLGHYTLCKKDAFCISCCKA